MSVTNLYYMYVYRISFSLMLIAAEILNAFFKIILKVEIGMVSAFTTHLKECMDSSVFVAIVALQN